MLCLLSIFETNYYYLRIYVKLLCVNYYFRRSVNVTIVRDLQSKIDKGDNIDFEQPMDVHTAAVLLKTFLRKIFYSGK